MVSIIILSYQNPQLTYQCIRSIDRNTTAEYEIIVVDNGRQLQANKCDLKQIRLIKNHNNRGYACGSNQGARLTRGEFLLFLNDDTIVTPDWLSAMLRVIQQGDKVGIVGSKLLFPDSHRIQHAGVVFVNRLPGHIYYNQDQAEVDINQIKEYPAVTGACLLIKKKLFLEVGGFDEGYINSYEDVDLCLKVRQRGYRIVYTPESLVYHYGSSSPGRHRYDYRNLRFLLQKWQGSDLLD